MIFDRVRSFIGVLRGISVVSQRVEQISNRNLVLSAQSLIWALRSADRVKRIQDVEFKVFSQFGDDGIIQYLIHRLGLHRDRFVEFGVEDYTEANTRFLLVNDDWQGLVMDGSEQNMNSVRESGLMWRHNITPRAAFITRENINTILREEKMVGEIGLLSIDIDGNDYFVWEAIDCISPIIVIAEYNSVFGIAPVTIPYQSDFRRTAAHYSNLYWGCSIGALHYLAERKGYALVGSNSAGNNAYFVRRDRLADLEEVSLRDAYVDSPFRESRAVDGSLTFLSGTDRRRAIADMPLLDVIRNTLLTVGDLE